MVGLALLLGSHTGIYLAGLRNVSAPAPRVRQLTFRRGPIHGARLAPDGHTIVFSAAWDGGTDRVLTARVGSPEWRSLDLPDGRVAAVSQDGEIAVMLRVRGRRGTLARVPLAGGAPRDVHEEVTGADWGPDGTLAITRSPKGVELIEYPPGKQLYEAAGTIASIRVSPLGDRVAFIEWSAGGADGSLRLLDKAGVTKVLVESPGLAGACWSASGSELWFAIESEGATTLEAVSVGGRRRTLFRALGRMTLLDVSRAGAALVSEETVQSQLLAWLPGDTHPRDLTWLDGSAAADISADGSALLFTEEGAGGGKGGAVYLRKTDGSPAVRLGEGLARALSPDGRWALVVSPASRLVLLPTGSGEPRSIPAGKITGFGWAGWFPDGRRIWFVGTEGREWPLWVQDIEGGPPKPLTSDGSFVAYPSQPVSPDGRLLFAASPTYRATRLYPTGGGDSRPLPGLEGSETPVAWSAEGRAILAARLDGLPGQVHRIDVASGQRSLVRDLQLPDPIGCVPPYRLVMAANGQACALSWRRKLSALYLIEGLGE